VVGEQLGGPLRNFGVGLGDFFRVRQFGLAAFSGAAIRGLSLLMAFDETDNPIAIHRPAHLPFVLEMVQVGDGLSHGKHDLMRVQRRGKSVLSSSPALRGSAQAASSSAQRASWCSTS
jgi:hypothetical protein